MNMPLIHGQSYSSNLTAEYRAWKALRNRCMNPRNKSFKDYGGRGIGVCERWQSFTNFFDDMGIKPSPKHSIERRDNDGDYGPGNCVWATSSEQRRNTRNSKLTREKVDEIRSLIGSVTGKEIAHRYGVCPMIVSNIKRGIIWK